MKIKWYIIWKKEQRCFPVYIIFVKCLWAEQVTKSNEENEP